MLKWVTVPRARRLGRRASEVTAHEETIAVLPNSCWNTFWQCIDARAEAVTEGLQDCGAPRHVLEQRLAIRWVSP